MKVKRRFEGGSLIALKLGVGLIGSGKFVPNRSDENHRHPLVNSQPKK